MTNSVAPSPAVLEELRTCALRIKPAVSAERLWNRYLKPQNRKRLGGDLQKAYYRYGTAGMWAEIHGVTPQRAVVEVAKKLGFLNEEDYEWLLSETGEVVDVEEAISIAIADGGLVLVEGARDAYWAGEQIDIDWHQQSALWDFLWVLARRSKSGKPIDAFAFGDRAGRNIVTKRKSRLSKMKGFPIELTDLIEPAGRGAQQLKLPPEKIRLFKLTDEDSLVEWLP